MKDLEELFDNFSDDEQYESRMVVCDYFCKADIGKHRCEDEEYETLIGLDATNIYDEYDSDLINGEYKHTEGGRGWGFTYIFFFIFKLMEGI